jgi:hypothetical protein
VASSARSASAKARSANLTRRVEAPARAGGEPGSGVNADDLAAGGAQRGQQEADELGDGDDVDLEVSAATARPGCLRRCPADGPRRPSAARAARFPPLVEQDRPPCGRRVGNLLVRAARRAVPRRGPRRGSGSGPARRATRSRAELPARLPRVDRDRARGDGGDGPDDPVSRRGGCGRLHKNAAAMTHKATPIPVAGAATSRPSCLPPVRARAVAAGSGVGAVDVRVVQRG